MTYLDCAALAYLNASGDSAKLKLDRRNADWRVRIRLFDARHEVIADSDPDLPATAPGADVVSGLHGVAGWAAGVVAALTSEPSAGIAQALKAKLPSLRVAIARRKGAPAIWRFVYPSRRGDLEFAVSVVRATARRAA